MPNLIINEHPLNRNTLIEASAGTGKTWTIAALYQRLILGHGRAGTAYARPLGPKDILVMTFTKAATRELVDRIRRELHRAADCFSGESAPDATAMCSGTWQDIQDNGGLKQGALRLRMAAESMDDAAVLTIDAWCQRMLREHAFDSGALFDEEILSDDSRLRKDALEDVWRKTFYDEKIQSLLELCPNFTQKTMETRIKEFHAFVTKQECGSGVSFSVQDWFALLQHLPDTYRDYGAQLRAAWEKLSVFFGQYLKETPWPFHGSRFKKDNFSVLYAVMEAAVGNYENIPLYRFVVQLVSKFPTLFKNLQPDVFPGIILKNHQQDVLSEYRPIESHFTVYSQLFQWMESENNCLTTMEDCFYQQAYQELQQQKSLRGQYGFYDIQRRLLEALQCSKTLCARIRQQFPVVLVDEFQDTSAVQYQILRLLYPNEPGQPYCLVMIGDPKQSIYRFRGADIHSYLNAKKELPEDSWYSLPCNYRSTPALVEVVNALFNYAETKQTKGAFAVAVPDQGTRLLAFSPVAASKISMPAVLQNLELPAVTVSCLPDALSTGKALLVLAEWASVAMEDLLNKGVSPASIAVLVRKKAESDAVRSALRNRGIPSVYLSDKESIFTSTEASSLLTWLRAVAHPQDTQLVRTAVASVLTGLSIPDAISDHLLHDAVQEQWFEWFLDLHRRWKQHGVLAMLQFAYQHLNTRYSDWLERTDWERFLANLMHLAELLQEASMSLQGMDALILWLQDTVMCARNDVQGGDEAYLQRLEREEDQIRVVTIHKSKGMEYPVVFLPFAAMWGRTNKKELDEANLDEPVEREEWQEQIRLLYVALTRAQYALWMGVANIRFGNGNNSVLHQTALGHLLGYQAGSVAVENTGVSLLSRMESVWKFDGSQRVLCAKTAEEISSVPTKAVVVQKPAVLVQNNSLPLPKLDIWNLGSYSRLLQRLSAVDFMPRKESDEPRIAPKLATASLPSGRQFGERVHKVLERWAQVGFAEGKLSYLVRQCFAASNWVERQSDIMQWLTAVARCRAANGLILQQLKAGQYLFEMEFYAHLPQYLDTNALDTWCSQALLNGSRQVAQLSTSQVRGMMTGIMDLVCLVEGRYWIVDYKTNLLADYQTTTLVEAAASHRYDIQGALYLLALHRHLSQRIADYQPQQHLGGFMLWFLRGYDQSSAGCLVWDMHDCAVINWFKGLEKLMPATPTNGVQ